MKKYLLSLLLVAGFIFGGVEKASATLTISAATTYGATVTLTNASGATNGLPITSFYINATGTTDDIFSQFTFTSAFPAGTNFTNFKLLVNNVNNIATAVNDNATFTGTGTTTMTVTTPENPNFGIGLPYDESYKNNTIYYFIVADYTASSAGSLTVNFASATYQTYANYLFGGGFNTVTQTTPVGQSYIFNPTPVVIANDLTGASLTAGPAVYYNQTNIAVAGISLNTNIGTTTLSQITFTIGASLAAANAFFANVRLVTSANPFTTGTTLTYVLSNTATTVKFTFSTPITINTTVTNFYLVGDYTNNGTIGPSFTFNPTNYTTVLSGTVTPSGYVANTYTPTAAVARTYYWWGAGGANTDWQLAANWTTNKNLNGQNLGTYPGANTADVATFSYDYWQGNSNTKTPTIGAYNITISALNISAVNDGATGVTLTINSANSLTVTNLTTANTGEFLPATSLTILGTTTGSTTPVLQLTGVATLGYISSLTAGTNGNITLSSGSSTSLSNLLAGATFYPGTLAVAGGAVIANNSAIAFATGNNYSGTISVTSGSLTINGGSVTMGGYLGNIKVSGGLFTANNCPFTISGNSPLITNSGGESDYNGSTLNFTGAVYNAYPFGMAISGGVVRMGGTTLADASSFNLGTLTTNGTSSTITSTAGNFYLGAYSTVNLLGASTTFSNTSGVIVCASTSTINPTSTSAVISNPAGAATSNSFTLLSDANGSATIGRLGVGAKMTGQYNVQRYISTASRNYRLLSSATNSTTYTPGNTGSPNQVNVSLLGKSATVPTTTPTTYPGAFTGGPAGIGGGFTATTGGPTMYLYQESIVPSLTNYNASFYSGKNVAITGLGTSSPFYLSTTSTANAVGGTGAIGADNATTVIVGPGNGYLLYYIHDNTNVSTTATLNAASTTASGYVNQGTIPLVLWGQSGSLVTNLDNNGVSPLVNPHDFAGLTMVGNPYPSSIDLQQLYKDNTGTTAVFTNGTTESFSELDPTNEQFATYGFDGTNFYTSGSDASRYVASGQGFYITVQKTNEVLTFYEDEKTASAPSTVTESIPVTNPVNTVDNVTHVTKITDALSKAVTANDFTSVNNVTKTVNSTTIKKSSGTDTVKFTIPSGLKVVAGSGTPVNNLPAPNNTPPPSSGSAGTSAAVAGLHLKLVQDSLDYDECGVYFSTKGSDKYDSNDAMDMDGVGGKVYLSSYTSDDVRTSINSLGDYKGGKRVPLFVKFSSAGIFQLQMSDIANFNTNKYSVFLIDNMLKDSLDLTLYKSYNFNYGPGTANDSTRFVLAIEHKPIPHYALLAFAGEKVTTGVQLNWKTLNEENTTTFVLQKLNANNAYVFLDSLQSDSAGAYAYVDEHPLLGNNTYRLQQTDGLGNITYSAPVTIGYNSTSPNGGLVVYPNPTKSTMTVTLSTSSIATQAATVDIYDLSGNRVDHKTVSSNSFTYDASAYKLGVYVIELKNSNGVLVGKSKFVKVQ